MIARIREADPALYEEMTKVGRRNIAMLTIAPTGTTSLMSQPSKAFLLIISKNSVPVKGSRSNKVFCSKTTA